MGNGIFICLELKDRPSIKEDLPASEGFKMNEMKRNILSFIGSAPRFLLFIAG